MVSKSERSTSNQKIQSFTPSSYVPKLTAWEPFLLAKGHIGGVKINEDFYIHSSFLDSHTSLPPSFLFWQSWQGPVISAELGEPGISWLHFTGKCLEEGDTLQGGGTTQGTGKDDLWFLRSGCPQHVKWIAFYSIKLLDILFGKFPFIHNLGKKYICQTDLVRNPSVSFLFKITNF